MEMRRECERCHVGLSDDGSAYVCSHECSFCPSCVRTLTFVCPNCSGELVRRPRRSSQGSPGRGAPRSPDPSVTVRRATLADLDSVAQLFDEYRVFYDQKSDLRESRRFLEERLRRGESEIWLAAGGEGAVGFVQLYPMFSSVSLGPVLVLNDLFVRPAARRAGLGALLLATARARGVAAGAHYLELSTAVDNPAQRLYEANGWSLDREFLHYELPLPRPALGDRTPPGI
jgi:ribosomal protein S18 acetylase RimI-like enzyme